MKALGTGDHADKIRVFLSAQSRQNGFLYFLLCVARHLFLLSFVLGLFTMAVSDRAAYLYQLP